MGVDTGVGVVEIACFTTARVEVGNTVCVGAGKVWVETIIGVGVASDVQAVTKTQINKMDKRFISTSISKSKRRFLC